jgi:hypothetical protein
VHPEEEVEVDLVLGSKLDMAVGKTDTEDKVTVDSDRSARVVVSTGQCHVGRHCHHPEWDSSLPQALLLCLKEEQARQEEVEFSPVPVL